MELEITNLDGGIKLVKLVGRMDLKGTNEIDNQFTFSTSSGKTPVLVDMSEVEFLASIGMRMLISNAKALAKRGSKMILFKPTPLVRDALVTAGFDELIPIFEDYDEACADLRAVATALSGT
jgi:anti-anti-sigma factor